MFLITKYLQSHMDLYDISPYNNAVDIPIIYYMFLSMLVLLQCMASRTLWGYTNSEQKHFTAGRGKSKYFLADWVQQTTDM